MQVPSGGTETVPLVEEGAVLRNVRRMYLESKDYTALEAGNAKKEIKICQSDDGPIHVLVTDIHLRSLGSNPAICDSMSRFTNSSQVNYFQLDTTGNYTQSGISVKDLFAA